MKVERSNFILVPNSALSTNVFLQSKCNMHGRYDMPAGAGVAKSHCWNRVRKPGQLIYYVRFWPHKWTFAKNRTAHAQTHYRKSTQWQWASFVSAAFVSISICIFSFIYLNIRFYNSDTRAICYLLCVQYSTKMYYKAQECYTKIVVK